MVAVYVPWRRGSLRPERPPPGRGCRRVAMPLPADQAGDAVAVFHAGPANSQCSGRGRSSRRRRSRGRRSGADQRRLVGPCPSARNFRGSPCASSGMRPKCPTRLITRCGTPWRWGRNGMTPQQVLADEEGDVHARRRSPLRRCRTSPATSIRRGRPTASPCPRAVPPGRRACPRCRCRRRRSPAFSIQKASGNSQSRNSPEPCDSGASKIWQYLP